MAVGVKKSLPYFLRRLPIVGGKRGGGAYRYLCSTLPEYFLGPLGEDPRHPSDSRAVNKIAGHSKAAALRELFFLVVTPYLCDDSVKATSSPGIVSGVSVDLHSGTRNVETLSNFEKRVYEESCESKHG